MTMKKTMWFLALGVVWLAGCPAPKPAAVDPAPFITAGDMFLKGIMQGRIEETYAQWVSPGIKINPRFSQQQFMADWQAIIHKYGALKKARLTYYQIVPGRQVQLYYQVTQGQAMPIEYHLVTETDPKGRCTVFFIDIGNGQVFPAGGGKPGDKIPLPQSLEVAP
jgi:hypothetical protein